MAFNGPMYRQERLSKDEIKLLLHAVRISSEDGSIQEHASYDRIEFLKQKLERMEKGRK